MTENSSPLETRDELPEPVADAIRKRHGPQPAVPETVDNAVLADANAYLQTISPPRPAAFRRRTWVCGTLTVGSLVAAAVVMVSVLNVQSPNVRNDGWVEQSATLSEAVVEAKVAALVAFSNDDIDQNGRVDILDAFALARTIRRGEGTSTAWDQNSDGQVNQDDVDLVARTAVML